MIIKFILLFFVSSTLWAEVTGIPATYSLSLKKTHPLYSYAINGPCGPLITLRSNRMPIKQTDLGFAHILEISDDMKSVIRWPAPEDASPVSINGNNLLIHIFEPGNNYVHVSKSGNISMAWDKPINSVTIHECPDVEGKPHIAEHLICTTLTDKKSNKSKIFAWARACT